MILILKRFRIQSVSEDLQQRDIALMYGLSLKWYNDF